MAIPRILPYSLNAACPPLENRVDWRIDSSRAVLLVHDMQNYFVDFYDRSQAPIKPVIEHCQQLIHHCESVGITTVYTAQPPNQKPQDRALLTDFWGPGLSEQNLASDQAKASDIISELAPSPNALQYTKWRYSAFQRTPLEQWMRSHQKDQLIICGVYAHIGILTTCLEGFMRDVQCFVVEDACADFSAADHTMARHYIAGRCGAIVNLEQTVRAITQATTRQNQNNSPEVFCAASLHRQIAQALQIHPEDFDANDNLMDVGLDSIRLMSLLEHWRNCGAQVDFMDLADEPTVDNWAKVLSASALPVPSKAAAAEPA
ncbi:MAG TPA: isochorismatase family protein [Marinagarivorans sp.]